MSTKKLGLLAVILGIFGCFNDTRASFFTPRAAQRPQPSVAPTGVTSGYTGGGGAPFQPQPQPRLQPQPSFQLPRLGADDEKLKLQRMGEIVQIAGYDTAKKEREVMVNPQSYVNTMERDVVGLERKYNPSTLKDLSWDRLASFHAYKKDILGQELTAWAVNDVKNAQRMRNLYDAVARIFTEKEQEHAALARRPRQVEERVPSAAVPTRAPAVVPSARTARQAGGGFFGRTGEKPVTAPVAKPFITPVLQPKAAGLNAEEQALLKQIEQIKQANPDAWNNLQQLTVQAGIAPDAIAWYRDKLAEMRASPDAERAQGYVLALMRLHSLLTGSEAQEVETLLNDFRNVRNQAQTGGAQARTSEEQILEETPRGRQSSEPLREEERKHSKGYGELEEEWRPTGEPTREALVGWSTTPRKEEFRAPIASERTTTAVPGPRGRVSGISVFGYAPVTQASARAAGSRTSAPRRGAPNFGELDARYSAIARLIDYQNRTVQSGQDVNRVINELQALREELLGIQQTMGETSFEQQGYLGLLEHVENDLQMLMVRRR